MSITIDFIIYTTDVCDIFLCICHVTMRCPGSGMVLDCICLLPSFFTHTNTDSQEIPFTVIASQNIVAGCPLGMLILYYTII